MSRPTSLRRLLWPLLSLLASGCLIEPNPSPGAGATGSFPSPTGDAASSADVAGGTTAGGGTTGNATAADAGAAAEDSATPQDTVTPHDATGPADGAPSLGDAARVPSREPADAG